MKRHNKHNPPAQLISDEKMTEMRKAGYTIDFIAEKAGLHPSTVGSRFRSWGVKPDYPIVAAARVDDNLYTVIDRLYWQENRTMQEIGEIVGLTESTVRWHMMQGGIPRRSREEHAKMAWDRGRQDRTRPRGFVLNRIRRLDEIQDKQDDEN